jgi:hypothetical protein
MLPPYDDSDHLLLQRLLLMYRDLVQYLDGTWQLEGPFLWSTSVPIGWKSFPPPFWSSPLACAYASSAERESLPSSRHSQALEKCRSKTQWSWALVAHTCNPGYWRDRDHEDCGSKPAWTNSLQDPILKKPKTKKGWWSGSRCRPCVPIPVLPKKKEREIMMRYCPVLIRISVIEANQPRK